MSDVIDIKLNIYCKFDFRVQSQAANDNFFDNRNDLLSKKNAHLVNSVNVYETIEEAIEYDAIAANCEAKPNPSNIYELENSEDKH